MSRSAQPLDEDRTDLGRRPGATGRRRRAIAAGGPGASPARPAARGTPSPVKAVVTSTSGRFGAGRSGQRHCGRRRHEHRPQLGRGPLRPGSVALVHDDDVRDLEQAGLDRLDLVAHLGRLEDHGRVGRRRDLDLALARTDGLEQDQVEAGRVEHRGRGRRCRRQAAGVAARRHRADEHAVVRAYACIRTRSPRSAPPVIGDRGVDRHDRDRPPCRAQRRDERRHERRLPDAGRPGDADEVRAAGRRVQPAQRVPPRPACDSRRRSASARAPADRPTSAASTSVAARAAGDSPRRHPRRAGGRWPG